MYIESVPNRGSPPAILLRESYREGGRVRKRTLLNLSDWPPERIAGFKALLKGGRVVAADPPAASSTATAAVTILRSLPHGHVAAALGTARKIGLDQVLGPAGNRCRDLVLALAIARVLDPGSKLAAARALSPETAASSLGSELGLGGVDEEELYRALDWLLVRQPAIERALARRHLGGGTLVLYDVTSSYLQGRCCPLARFGYNRDGKPGKLQIVYGLLCAPDGCPVAVKCLTATLPIPLPLAPRSTSSRDAWPRPCRAGRRPRHDHPGPHQPPNSGPMGSTGSPPCAPRRSAAWSKAAPCSSRCSTSATWRRSPRRIIPASG